MTLDVVHVHTYQHKWGQKKTQAFLYLLLVMKSNHSQETSHGKWIVMYMYIDGNDYTLYKSHVWLLLIS